MPLTPLLKLVAGSYLIGVKWHIALKTIHVTKIKQLKMDV
jgi:hypothetical protein